MKAIITVLGKDNVGIVASVAAYLAEKESTYSKFHRLSLTATLI